MVAEAMMRSMGEQDDARGSSVQQDARTCSRANLKQPAAADASRNSHALIGKTVMIAAPASRTTPTSTSRARYPAGDPVRPATASSDQQMDWLDKLRQDGHRLGPFQHQVVHQFGDSTEPELAGVLGRSDRLDHDAAGHRPDRHTARA
jgi:hypothetical protein